MADKKSQLDSLEDVLDRTLNEKDKNDVYSLLFGKQLRYNLKFSSN